MDKKVINEEQFRKLVINEAKRMMAEEKGSPEKKESAPNNKKVTAEDVEALISEIQSMNKSISSLHKELETNESDDSKVINEEVDEKIMRDTNMDEYNQKKNVFHPSENEKDKWNRMLNYNIPKDKDR